MAALDTTEDLIIDCAEVNCDVEVIENGNVKQVHQVSAYPTRTTRDLTNNLPNTTDDLAQIAKKCRWVTPGIIRFYIRPSTRQIAEARPTLGYIEISLQTLLNEQHKRQLANEARNMYRNLPVTAGISRSIRSDSFLQNYKSPFMRRNGSFTVH